MMSLMKWLFGPSQSPANGRRSKRRRTRSLRNDKLIIVKHKGRQKRYRINEYGEAVEER